MVPVVVSCHPGFATDTLPTGGGEVLAVGAPQGEVGEHVEDASSAQAASIDIEEVEDQSRRQALGQSGAGSAVPGNVGGGEVVLDEARAYGR